MKNIDYVNVVIAKRLGVDEKTVKAVNKFYWHKGVRKKLSTLEHTSVFVKGLLTFTASRYNVRTEIKKTIGKIRNTRISPKLTETTRNIYLDNHFERLRKLLNQRNLIAIKYYKDEKSKRVC